MEILKTVEAIKEIYRQIEEKTDAFKKATGIDCVYGCGECCNRFEPYSSVLEMLVIAEHLKQNPEELELFWKAPRDKEKNLCAFYKPDSPYHCGIYKIRPLICRLYSFSGKAIPEEKMTYISCPQIKTYYGIKVSKAIELIENGFPIATYKEEYPKICKLDLILATDFHPITRSLEIALENMVDIENGIYQRKKEESDLSSMIAVPFGDLIRNSIKSKLEKTAFVTI